MRTPGGFARSLKVVFKSGQSIRFMLTKVKDPLTKEKQAKVVYHIPCSCGKAYIGKTVRRHETRVKEGCLSEEHAAEVSSG